MKKDFYYQLKNPEKYNGKRPIIMRSKYEKDFAKKLDQNEYIKTWNSETIKIKYKFPYYLKNYVIKKNKRDLIRTYYIDFMYTTIDNKIRLVEIKNMSLLNEPKFTGNNKRGYIYHKFYYKKNLAKFEQTRLYCELFNDIDIKFIVSSGYNFDFKQ